MITEIKKGDRFRCTRSYYEGSDLLHLEGQEYISENDGCITDITGNNDDKWDVSSTNLYFAKLDSDTQQDLTREAIEQDEVESVMHVYAEDKDKPVAVFNSKPYPGQIDWNKLAEFEVKDQASRQFDTGSKRDNDDNKPLVNHIDPYTRLRFGHLLRAGATKYGINNWRLGQPTETALESLHRHLAKFELNLKNGIEQDEDHIMSCIFNLQLIAMNEEKQGITVDHFYKKK